jgi:hypothetical protein
MQGKFIFRVLKSWKCFKIFSSWISTNISRSISTYHSWVDFFGMNCGLDLIPIQIKPWSNRTRLYLVLGQATMQRYSASCSSPRCSMSSDFDGLDNEASGLVGCRLGTSERWGWLGEAGSCLWLPVRGSAAEQDRTWPRPKAGLRGQRRHKSTTREGEKRRRRRDPERPRRRAGERRLDATQARGGGWRWRRGLLVLGLFVCTGPRPGLQPRTQIRHCWPSIFGIGTVLCAGAWWYSLHAQL